MFATNFRLPKISLSLSKFLQMKLNSFLFRFLPFSVSRCYVMVLGRLYYLLNWTEKTLIRKTIKHVFGRKIPAPILKKKVKAAFKGIFDHYHEKLFVGYSNFPKLLKFLKSQVRFAGCGDIFRQPYRMARGSSWSPVTSAQWSFCPAPWR